MHLCRIGAQSILIVYDSQVVEYTQREYSQREGECPACPTSARLDKVSCFITRRAGPY